MSKIWNLFPTDSGGSATLDDVSKYDVIGEVWEAVLQARSPSSFTSLFNLR